MSTAKLDNSHWTSYFDNVSRTIGRKQVKIEVAGLSLGSQVEVRSLTLCGLTYDAKDDVFEVLTESIGHVIKHPKGIHIDYGVNGLHSIEIHDADNNYQIIRFAEPVAFPTRKQ